MQAKKDDFEEAWAQCLPAMLAAQQINNRQNQTIFGGVSNGEAWLFSKLHGTTFLQDPRLFTLTHLDELFAALNYLFQQTKQQAQTP